MKAYITKMKNCTWKNSKQVVVSADCTWYVEMKTINIIKMNKIYV